MKQVLALLVAFTVMSCGDSEARGGGPSLAQSANPTHSTTLLSSPCVTDADCIRTDLGEDCCSQCDKRAVTRASLQALESRCSGTNASCPQLDCALEENEAACVQGVCVLRPI